MTKLPAILALIFCAVMFSPALSAQEEAVAWEIKALNQVIPGTVEGKVDYDFGNRHGNLLAWRVCSLR